MVSTGDGGATGGLERVQTAAREAFEPGTKAAVLAILGVGGQILAFLLGFQAATGQPPSTGWARVAAIAGLGAVLLVLGVLAHLVDDGWISRRAVLVFLAAGAFAGGVVAFYLPSELVGPAGELFVYTAVVLLYGTLVVGLLLLAGGIAYMAGHPWWRPLLAAPVLLHTGAHAVVLLGLAIQAGTLAEAAALVPLAGV